jgi:hypothetical protein
MTRGQHSGEGGRTMGDEGGRYGRDDADEDKKSFRIEIWHFIVELIRLYSQIERFIIGSNALKKLIS